MRKMRGILKLLPFLVFAVSCSKKDKTGLLIPKDALMVVHFDLSSLSSKLSWDEIKQTQLFQNAYNEGHDDSLHHRLLNDPDASGMDFKSGMAFFLKKQGNGMYAVIEGKVKNPAALDSFFLASAGESKTEKDGQFTIIKHHHGIVARNENNFAYIFNPPFKTNYEEDQTVFSNDSLKFFVEKVLSLSGSDLLGTDERFASLINEQGDIHIWINAQQYFNTMSNSNSNSYLSMFDLNSLMNNNASAITLSFDPGKISLKTKHYVSDQMKEVYKKFAPQNVDASLINKIPSDDPLAVLAVNYNPESLKEILKLTNLDGIVNGFLGKTGITLDEFIQANKGTLLVAVPGYDMKSVIDTVGREKKKPITYTMQKPEIKFLFANAVKDKAAFNKLLGLIDKEKDMISSKMPNITYTIQGDWFVVSNSPEDISSFLAGSNHKLAIADRISGHPMGGYINLQKIVSLSSSMRSRKPDSSYLATSQNMWKDIIFTGGDFKDDALSSQLEINLVDKNTNSLKQLDQYIDKLMTSPGIFNFHDRSIHTDSLRSFSPQP